MLTFNASARRGCKHLSHDLGEVEWFFVIQASVIVIFSIGISLVTASTSPGATSSSTLLAGTHASQLTGSTRVLCIGSSYGIVGWLLWLRDTRV
jgi:hypothetical protein